MNLGAVVITCPRCGTELQCTLRCGDTYIDWSAPNAPLTLPISIEPPAHGCGPNGDGEPLPVAA